MKRTALGRFKHEGAANVVNKDGRFVVYMGDDERFDYVYKFVTEGRVDTQNRAANRDILDRGTLYVAKYNADGTGEWIPLVQGQGPADGGERLPLPGRRAHRDAPRRRSRSARPRWTARRGREVNAKTGKVYVMLTNNTRRKADQVDAANPRADNAFGHIVEMLPDGGDHAATRFRWEVLLKCGDPSVAAVGATFSSATTKDGWFGMPDMVVLDSEGRLWIGTDGMSEKATGRTDGLYARRYGRADARNLEAVLPLPRRAPSCAGRSSRRTTPPSS